MAFKYNPPTRTFCPVCEKLEKNSRNPIIDTNSGKASEANGYPFHDWYNFVLGYTPVFPEYMLQREQIKTGDLVLDPFNGSGTTQLVCKLKGIESYGIDANDYMIWAASKKLDWDYDIKLFGETKTDIIGKCQDKISEVNWDDSETVKKMIGDQRPDMLTERYFSDKPYLKTLLIKDTCSKIEDEKLKDLFNFALSSILVPVSNVRYGPGFGVSKPKDDVDVLKVFEDKLNMMYWDLMRVSDQQKHTVTHTKLGDSRRLSQYIKENSIQLIITSPPYPGDHEYTKHTRIELIFENMAVDMASFRVIKKRMLRSSTTNIYKDDNEYEAISDIQSIIDVTSLIQERLDADGATSGFEKLYTRLVKEYFGGMYNNLLECYKVLKPGGKISLLVSDSHAFKMVHIQTAEILKEIGLKAGFVNPEIELWQMKNSTSHKYQLRENILILQKPE